MIAVIVEVRATLQPASANHKVGKPQYITIALLPSIISFAQRRDAEQYAATIYKDSTISLVPRLLSETDDEQPLPLDPTRQTA